MRSRTSWACPVEPAMPEWLENAFNVPPIPAMTLAIRLILAAALGAAVALVYRLSHGRNSRDAHTLTATLVLLAILLAMVSMVIGDSVARAFGLVGALSIVRFRTVVEDTRDTAFVIFAVIVGMAVGTGLLLVPLIGLPVVAGAAIAMSRRGPALSTPEREHAAGSMALTVRLSLGRDPDATLAPVLARHTSTARLTGLATARQGSALDAAYAVTMTRQSTPASLVQEINALDGVQSVELRDDGSDD